MSSSRLRVQILERDDGIRKYYAVRSMPQVDGTYPTPNRNSQIRRSLGPSDVPTPCFLLVINPAGVFHFSRLVHTRQASG